MNNTAEMNSKTPKPSKNRTKKFQLENHRLQKLLGYTYYGNHSRSKKMIPKFMTATKINAQKSLYQEYLIRS